MSSRENFFAAATFTYQAGLAAGAKTLLADEPVAMLDPIQALPPALDGNIELELPASSLRKTVAADSKGYWRDATSKSRLARVTVYWPEEGDFYTRNRKSSTGARLRDGHCAVDPKIIPSSLLHNCEVFNQRRNNSCIKAALRRMSAWVPFTDAQ